MKNLMIVLTLILGVSIFSSCSKEECETCTYTFMWMDAEGNEVAVADYEENADETAAREATIAGYSDGELCDDALTDAKDAFTTAGGENGVMSGDAEEAHEECCVGEGEDADPTHDAYHSHMATAAWTYTMTCQASE